MATIGIVTIIKFVGMDEVPLVLVLVVCLEELVRERTLISLIISRVTSILGSQIVSTTHSWSVVSNCETRN